MLAKDLLDEIRVNLPMQVSPTMELQKLMVEKGIKVSKNHIFQIENVYYMGDGGGICCGISLPDELIEALVVSITQIRIHPSHLLAKKIARYQKKRIKKLLRQRMY